MNDTLPKNGVCPKCGSKEFRPVSSLGRKAAFGLLSLAMKKNRLECLRCGRRFVRG